VVEFSWRKPIASRFAGRLCFGVLLVAAVALRWRNIQGSLPYSGHVDEHTVLGVARAIARSGDFNPHYFRYPSLPIYLAAAVLAVVRALGGESLAGTWLVSASYYAQPAPVAAVKLAFALLSVIALVALGVTARRVVPGTHGLWLAPLLACLAPSFFRLSWSYVNVDIAGACFALATVAYLVSVAGRALGPISSNVRAVRPLFLGALAGLTVGCKYNLFPICIPCVLWIALYERGRRVVSLTTFVAGAGLAFLITTPYALLDFRTFYADVSYEVRHYAVGKKQVFDPLDRVRTSKRVLLHLWGNWGAAPLVASLFGVVLAFKRNRRLAVLAFSYPFSLAAYMAAQRTFFERNLVAIHLFIALGLAVALSELPGLLTRRWSARLPHASRAGPWLAVVLDAALVLQLPWSETLWAYRSGVEPRSVAARWLERHVGPGTALAVDKELRFEPSALARYAVETVVKPPTAAARAKSTQPAYALVGPKLAEEYESVFGPAVVSARFQRVARLVPVPRADEGEGSVTVVRLGPGASERRTPR
jgi:hypothetical protein